MSHYDCKCCDLPNGVGHSVCPHCQSGKCHLGVEVSCDCPPASCKGLNDAALPGNCRFLKGEPAKIEAMVIEAVASVTRPSLPDDAQARLEYPMADGLLDYFPNALAEVARLSHLATQQHHPEKGMHWDRSKSLDHRNKIMRHLVDTHTVDDKGIDHWAMVCWRALAGYQTYLEEKHSLPPSRASRNHPAQ